MSEPPSIGQAHLNSLMSSNEEQPIMGDNTSDTTYNTTHNNTKNNALDHSTPSANGQNTSVLLSLEALSLCAGSECVISQMSFQVHQGEIICLLGPSGCGKTTTLRAIAGFVRPTSGVINLANQVVASPNSLMPPERRKVGMIFQDHALFPHLTVEGNIAFGLRKLPRTEQAERIAHYMELVQIGKLAKKFPHELSGGQQQRVAVARALAPHPRLLLMDEPFSNLDVNLRKDMQQQLQAVLRKEGITAIMVTHDQEESFAMADRVALLCDGQLQQIDTPYTLYHKPANREVAAFIGLGSYINATVTNPHHLQTEAGIIKSQEALNWSVGHSLDLLLRPDDILPNPDSALKARVTHKIFQGAATQYRLSLSQGTPLEAIFPSHFDYQIGDTIGIEIQTNHVVIFEKQPKTSPL